MEQRVEKGELCGVRRAWRAKKAPGKVCWGLNQEHQVPFPFTLGKMEDDWELS